MTAQADFAAALLETVPRGPAGLRAWNGSDPALRFAVHRNNVVASLVAALADTYPVVRSLVGAPFFDTMAAAYVRFHPPASPVLAGYGEGLADWLVGHAPARALPYLPDMARLEHARVAACHAADAAPLATATLAARVADAAALPTARLSLHPSFRVLRSAYAIHALWAAHQQDDDWAPVDVDVPCAMLVLRDPADAVLVIGVDAATAAFCSALRDGASLGEALHVAPDLDLSGAFALLIRHGAVVAWHDNRLSP